MQLHIIPTFALVLLASCACRHGAPPPTSTVVATDAADPVPTPVDASAPVDAAPPLVDAPPPSIDAGASAGTGGSGYVTRRLIKCTITSAEDNGIGFTCERAVKRGWKGDLWNDATDKPINGSRFEVVGSSPPERVEAAARLPHPLSVYGDVKTVRIVEQY